MTIYASRDVGRTFEGDLIIDSKGDIELATSFNSHKSAINFLIRTDKGSYAPDNRIGCDLGSFIGELNTRENTFAIENSCLENLTEFLVQSSDIEVHAIPMSIEDVGIFIGIVGSYIDSDGNIISSGSPEILTYTYSYLGGNPTPAIQ